MSRHGDFLVVLASTCHVQSYLELGVYQGEVLLRMAEIVPRCVGVEREAHVVPTHLDVRRQSTVEFFQTNTETFDMVFIDADHCFAAAQADFIGAEACLTPSGIVILHDTNPVHAGLLSDGYCSDSYKMISWLLSLRVFNVLTLPVDDPGLTVVTRKNSERVWSFV